MSHTTIKLRCAVAVMIIVVGTMGNTARAATLSQIVPEPPNLLQFVKDKVAAIQLGKALFWDMQVGSDGVQACASCHYRAGADPVSSPNRSLGFEQFTSHKRTRDRLHPGPDTQFGNSTTVLNTFDPLTTVPGILTAIGYPFTPLYTLQAGDFPFFRPNPANARLAIDPLTGLTTDGVTSLRDTNDVVGSPGIRLNLFNAIALPTTDAVDLGTPTPDLVFNDGAGNNLRRVTSRKAPSVINAVFNYSNNWDGRANNIFNGVNPYGPLDQSARIWVNNTGTPGGAAVQEQIAIRNASLASQATEPPISDAYMSYSGRTFPDLGRKMLDPSTIPLKRQLVSVNDSVLGALSNAVVPGTTGLSTSYAQMIRDAFNDPYWNGAAVSGGFTQMEANFALFFGLAIQLYEATLVADRTPYDRFLAGNLNGLSLEAQRGYTTFVGKCATCHSGIELTSAATGSTFAGSNPTAFTNNTTHNLIKTNINPTTLAVKLIDAGFYNTGVRPTADDIGRGGTAPSGLPLSFSRLGGLAGLPFATPQLPQISVTQPDAVNGSFKVPGLRNIELTAPYFHNGDAYTLCQVIEFYTRGGNFPGNPELAAAIQPIGNLRKEISCPPGGGQAELVAFLLSLTDDRVKNETAPFDHPQLLIAHGTPENFADPATIVTIPATGGAPAPVTPALTLNPVVSPTILTSQVLSGVVDVDATVTVSLNGAPPSIATVTANTWTATVTGMLVGPPNTVSITATSPTGGTQTLTATINVLPSATITGAPTTITTLTFVTLTIGGTGIVSYQYKLDNGTFSGDIPVATPLSLNGLSDAVHTVSVLGKDSLGNQQPLANATTATWTVKATPPILTITSIATPTIYDRQTIGGSVDLGVIPSVTADTSVTIGPVFITSTNWSCTLTGLLKGANTVTVTAVDNAFNRTVQTATIDLVTPDGNFKGSGVTDISDAVKALRMAAGIVAPTANDLQHGDVAPLVNGIPKPDSKIDVADALVILRKVVGLVSF